MKKMGDCGKAGEKHGHLGCKNPKTKRNVFVRRIPKAMGFQEIYG